MVSILVLLSPTHLPCLYKFSLTYIHVWEEYPLESPSRKHLCNIQELSQLSSHDQFQVIPQSTDKTTV